MRLICPNCDAQYEVDAGMIPAEGRDVQCSACGHVWFQSPWTAEDEDEAMDWAAGDLPAPPADPGPAAPVQQRHSLDESMLAVLREEAERETQARAREAARAAGRGIESQPELGLPEAPSPSRLRIRQRPAPDPDDLDPDPATAPADVHDAPPEPVTQQARGARRELLPDIEQINSTLDASSAARKGGAQLRVPAAPERRRAGFRLGFLLVLLLAVLAALAYVQAPRIAGSLPAAAPVIEGYVASVDRARIWLDGVTRGVLSGSDG